MMKIRMTGNHKPMIETFRKQNKAFYQGAIGTLPYVEDQQDKGLLVRGRNNQPLVQKKGLGQSLLTSADRRKEVTNPSSMPWRMICSLEIMAEDGGLYIGTGWLAGPRLIMTAGHCVFDQHVMNGWAKSIKVYPGRSSATSNDDCLISEIFRAPDQWVAKCDENFDYGAIILDNDIGLQYGHFSSATYSDSELMAHMVNISGYPGTKAGEIQLHHENRINSVSPTKIYYDVDTEGGQSGSPVWLYEDNESMPVVVGIHSYGAGKIAIGNSGVRITEEIINFIEKWREY
jgi:glutamyl endopeptidase